MRYTEYVSVKTTLIMPITKTCAHGCIDGKLAVANGPDDFDMDFCSCPLGDALMERMATDPVQVRVMGLVEEIKEKSRAVAELSAKSIREVVWSRGRVLSPSLPDVRMRF